MPHFPEQSCGYPENTTSQTPKRSRSTQTHTDTSACTRAHTHKQTRTCVCVCVILPLTWLLSLSLSTKMRSYRDIPDHCEKLCISSCPPVHKYYVVRSYQGSPHTHTHERNGLRFSSNWLAQLVEAAPSARRRKA